MLSAVYFYGLYLVSWPFFTLKKGANEIYMNRMVQTEFYMHLWLIIFNNKCIFEIMQSIVLVDF